MSETKIVANRLDQTAEFTFNALALGNGTVSAPAVAFTNGQGSGMFLFGSSPTEQLSFACRGVSILSSNSVGLFANVSLQTIDGTASAPAITFASDPNTGFWKSAVDTIAVTVGGVGEFQFDLTQFASLLPIRGPIGSASVPTYSFNGDTNTGMSGGADVISLSTGGITRFTLENAWATVLVPLRIQDGSVSTPGILFDADANTGIYRGGVDAIGMAGNGVNMYAVSPTEHDFYLSGVTKFVLYPTNAQFIYPVQMADGTVSVPAISFATDTNTGIYRAASDDVSISLGGVQRWSFEHPVTYFYGNTIADASALSINVQNSGTGNSALNILGTGAGQTVLGQLGSASAVSFWVGGPAGASAGYVQSTGSKLIIQNSAANTYFHSDSASPMWQYVYGANGVVFQIVNTGPQIPDGTLGAPGLSFMNDTNTGFYRNGADEFRAVCGGTSVMDFFSTGITCQTVFEVPNGTVTAPSLTFANDLNNGFYLAGTDDVRLAVAGAIQIIFQASATYSNKNLNSNGPAAFNLGDAANYWNDVSYKTLTDRGCLPFCDDGVELADGSIVTDLEAIKSIEKHPTKLTVQGLPMLNYKTFPKKAYKPAEVNGQLLERDVNDEPINGQDGIEMTMMFGVMIGAFKELCNKIETLENRIKTLEG